ncbi:MAG: hypothetical protein LWX08_15310 [Deltaproteobacteria bacterium]|jgi:hypothetical protein|nr:hypothetical protein [Deltaproteobacteria bacterium]
MRKINDFFNIHTFVVLGEPGLGKTTSFQYAAKKETNAVFVRIGEFLSAPNLDHLIGKVLYLDGLDEHRSRANGMDVMDAIIGRLKQLNSPKVRISCRTAEWHGGKDIGALSAVSNGTPIVQLNLQPLKPEDILTLIPDAEDFVQGAHDHGLDEFLKNPQDFFLLHEFYCEKNSWPDNRSELMEGACKSLLKELNKQHYEAVDDWVGDRDLTRASDYLASILILSNIAGISSDRTTANKLFPSIHEFDGDLFAMKVATGRHVFKPAEKKRIEPKHRKIAEYMAARYLAARVREGLPLRRVMALMTGIDGGTPPDLRGVYAWLVTMLSGMADHVLAHDPYGAIIYGDARAWTPNTKKSALTALQELAKKDPWFRNQDRSRPALGGLSDPALLEDFKQFLLEEKSETHLLSTILDAIAGGSKLPEIGDALLDFIRNPDKLNHLKSTAIDAFATACPERKTDLVTLLDEVHAGDVSDKDQYLRGSLLRILYPTVIGPDRVVDYLIKPSGNVIGWYHMFVSHTIFEITDKDALRILVQTFQNQDSDFLEGDDYNVRSFVSNLISKLIENFGEEVEINELFLWLTIGLNKYEVSRIRREKTEVIRTFLAAHDKMYISLFLYFFNNRWTDGMDWHQMWWRFKEFVLYVPPPHDFPKALLTTLKQEMDMDEARALYELACVLVMDDDPSFSSVTIEELLEISKSRSEFNGIFERASKCDIEEWRKEDAMHKKRQVDERETRQARNIENLAPHKVAIEAGEALSILEHYSRIWFDLFIDIDHEATPKERLCQEVGDEMAKSIELGFLKALYKPIFYTLKDIAETAARNRSYHHGYLILAAMDILADIKKDDVLNLPEEILCLAIAYEMANPIKRNFQWPMWLIVEKPGFYSRVLDKYWRAQLAIKPESITNFYEFNGDEPLLPLVKKILPKLLRDFPKAHPRLLKSMLLNAIRFCPFEEILPLVTNALTFHFDRKSGQRTMWIATGFVIAQDEYLNRLKTQLQKNDQNKWAARPILMANIWKRGEDSKHISSIRYRKLTIELIGGVFKNVFHESGGRWIGDQDEPTAASEIRRLIHAFAEDPSDDAASALADLVKNPTLPHWHTDIIYTIANQVRTACEARFTYPDVSQVVSMLSNSEPANVADLKAIVIEALKEVADEIRHGNTDGYKSFWNIGQHSKATDKHVDENTARDRLLELLRPKLRHIDITAEPEVRYADDKRADIAIYSRGMKLPIEIKGDYHDKIWDAAENQLKKQYSRDPASEGNGIYLVFWLDGKRITKPPKGFKKPTNAGELKRALKSTVPEASAGLIDVIVIDVSVPAGKKATEKAPRAKKAKS